MNTSKREQAYMLMAQLLAAKEKLVLAELEFNKVNNEFCQLLHETFPLEGGQP